MSKPDHYRQQYKKIKTAPDVIKIHCCLEVVAADELQASTVSKVNKVFFIFVSVVDFILADLLRRK